MNEDRNSRIHGYATRGVEMTIYLDDRPIRAFSGESVAAALMAAGVRAFRKSRLGEARGPYCGIGNCFDCVLTVDGRPNVRTCNLPVRDGMALRNDNNEVSGLDTGSRMSGDQEEPSGMGPAVRERQLVIVGGGPAGMCAAVEAAKSGVRECTLVDEAPALGGQIYRCMPGEFSPGEKYRESKDFVRGEALRDEFEASADRVERMSNTAVLGVWIDPTPRILCGGGDDGCEILATSKLIIATGAYDRPVAFPGWTLPGGDGGRRCAEPRQDHGDPSGQARPCCRDRSIAPGGRQPARGFRRGSRGRPGSWSTARQGEGCGGPCSATAI